MINLIKEDYLLIEKAKKTIEDIYDGSKRHRVGVGLRAKSGNVYTGIDIDGIHGASGELTALGSAIANGEKEFDTIVAIKNDGEIIPPCGNCRQVLFEYAPNIYVIIKTDKGEKKIKIEDLLPNPYITNSR